MLLSYVDDSYDRGKAWFYLAALLVPDRQAVSLTRRLDQVAASATMAFHVPADAELHGYELLQAKGAWKAMTREVRARIAVYADALQAIADHDVSIILRGVHGQALTRRYRHPLDPHKVVLGHTLERINGYAEAADDYALVIADEIAEAAQHRADLSTYQALGTGGFRHSSLPRIVDTMHFAPSYASRLVQAADLVAFMYHRVERVTVGDKRSLAASQRLWEMLRPRIVHQHCWDPAPR